jgi:hypothetical protein
LNELTADRVDISSTFQQYFRGCARLAHVTLMVGESRFGIRGKLFFCRRQFLARLNHFSPAQVLREVA